VGAGGLACPNERRSRISAAAKSFVSGYGFSRIAKDRERAA